MDLVFLLSLAAIKPRAILIPDKRRFFPRIIVTTRSNAPEVVVYCLCRPLFAGVKLAHIIFAKCFLQRPVKIRCNVFLVRRYAVVFCFERGLSDVFALREYGQSRRSYSTQTHVACSTFSVRRKRQRAHGLAAETRCTNYPLSNSSL